MDRAKEALRLAGLMAIASRRALSGTALELGDSLKRLKTATDDYDNHMIRWHQEEDLAKRKAKSAGSTEEEHKAHGRGRRDGQHGASGRRVRRGQEGPRGNFSSDDQIRNLREAEASSKLNLHVYKNNDFHVIAYSSDDCETVWLEQVREKYDPEDGGPWVLVPDATKIPIQWDNGRGMRLRNRTAKQWIKECGRGYLCGPES